MTVCVVEERRNDSKIQLYFLVLLSILILLGHPTRSFAEKAPRDYMTFTYYQENDVFNGTDREYTGGAKYTWISRDLTCFRLDPRLPCWSYPLIEFLPFVNEPGFQRNLSVSFGQSLYVPDDIERTDLIEDSRPYAGVAYLALGFHSKNKDRMDTLEFNVGIVGPHSYSEETQSKIHEWFGAAKPQGWDNQLNDEIIINVHMERKWKWLTCHLGYGFSTDLIPHVGASLGNGLTEAGIGSQVRFGWHLPNDYGTYVIRPGSDSNAPIDRDDPRFFPAGKRYGVHVFAGFDARAVARNILLDGNTFSSSHHVEKYPLTGRLMAGLGFIVHRMKFSLSYVFETRQYTTQEDEQIYGSFTASFSF